GSNATGVTLLTNLMEPKRLGLLRELAPGVPLIGVLLNPKFAPASRQLRQVEEAARSIDQRIVVAHAGTDEEHETAFAAFRRERMGALLVRPALSSDRRGEQFFLLAAGRRRPAFYHFREYVRGGGLRSYGVSITDAYRNSGFSPGSFLKGANPADLP